MITTPKETMNTKAKPVSEGFHTATPYLIITNAARSIEFYKDQFYGDRSGPLTGPFGHKWTISTHKEDVPPEEAKRRASAIFGMS